MGLELDNQKGIIRWLSAGTSLGTDGEFGWDGTNWRFREAGADRLLPPPPGTLGNFLYSNGSAWTILNYGISGQVLKAVTGAPPEWGSVQDGDIATGYIKADGTRAFTGNQSFALHQATNLRLENLASDPAAGNAGRVIYRTDTKKLRLDDGAAWADVGGSSPTALFSSSYDSVTLNPGNGLSNIYATIPANTLAVGDFIDVLAAGSVLLMDGFQFAGTDLYGSIAGSAVESARFTCAATGTSGSCNYCITFHGTSTVETGAVNINTTTSNTIKVILNNSGGSQATGYIRQFNVTLTKAP